MYNAAWQEEVFCYKRQKINNIRPVKGESLCQREFLVVVKSGKTSFSDSQLRETEVVLWLMKQCQ